MVLAVPVRGLEATTVSLPEFTQQLRQPNLNHFVASTRAAWTLMHLFAQGFTGDVLDRDERLYFMLLLVSIGRNLGCAPCGDHWITVMRRLHPLRDVFLRTPNTTVCFMYDLHNIWNSLRHAPQFSWADYQTLYNYPHDYQEVVRLTVSGSDAVMRIVGAYESQLHIFYPPIVSCQTCATVST